MGAVIGMGVWDSENFAQAGPMLDLYAKQKNGLRPKP